MYILQSTFRRCLIPVFFFVLLGCNKLKEGPIQFKPKPLYDFSTTGSSYLGGHLCFSSTAPSGSSLSWDFGDGIVSGEISPVHVYGRAGAFTAVLTVNGDKANRVSKVIKIGSDSTQTLLLGGMRVWHHSIHSSRSVPGGVVESNWYYPDASFAVNIVDPITVLVGNDSLVFSFSNDSLLVFTHPFYIQGHSTLDANTLSYHYIRDTIYYALSRHTGAASSSTELFKTP